MGWSLLRHVLKSLAAMAFQDYSTSLSILHIDIYVVQEGDCCYDPVLRFRGFRTNDMLHVRNYISPTSQ